MKRSAWMCYTWFTKFVYVLQIWIILNGIAILISLSACFLLTHTINWLLIFLIYSVNLLNFVNNFSQYCIDSLRLCHKKISLQTNSGSLFLMVFVFTFIHNLYTFYLVECCLQVLLLWWINRERVDLFVPFYIVRIKCSVSWSSPAAFSQIYSEDKNTELKDLEILQTFQERSVNMMKVLEHTSGRRGLQLLRRAVYEKEDIGLTLTHRKSLQGFQK